MLNIVRAKCIVAGDSAVGKTSIIQVLQSQLTNFPKSYNMTMGVELSTKTVAVEASANSVVEFYFLDSSGKDIYKDALTKYWEEPELLALVFDVTNESSLKSCSKWSEVIKSLSGNDDSCVPGVLIGNKIDNSERRVISSEQGKETANKLGLQYFECSAKTMTGIAAPFDALAKILSNGKLRKI